MKMCNTEIMKEIKILEDKKNEILNLEKEECKVVYLEKEKQEESSYDFKRVRKEVDLLDEKIRKYKTILAYSNATVMVEEFNMTIGEALIYLASLNSKKALLTEYASKRQVSRVSSLYNTKVEYVKLLYNVNEVKEEVLNLQRLIAKLQMAIDRVNLTNMIEF